MTISNSVCFGCLLGFLRASSLSLLGRNNVLLKMYPLCFWFCIYEYLFPQNQVSTKNPQQRSTMLESSNNHSFDFGNTGFRTQSSEHDIELEFKGWSPLNTYVNIS